MADDDVNGDSDDIQQEKSQKKAAKYDSGAADLEKVTDYAEEKEISSSDGFSCVSMPLRLHVHPEPRSHTRLPFFFYFFTFKVECMKQSLKVVAFLFTKVAYPKMKKRISIRNNVSCNLKSVTFSYFISFSFVFFMCTKLILISTLKNIYIYI